MDLGLKGKIAVITGGTVGIGLAIAEGLAAEGCNLVLVGRDGARAQAEADRLATEFGVRAIAVSADVATAAGCDAVIAAAGAVDILVNNAGTGSNETIQEADDAKWQYYWDLHVMAAVRLARGLVPGMKQRGGGAIIHNASICAVQPLWYEPIYNTTKAALMMFSKTLANELVGDNIRVNTVNPGLVLTPDWIKTARQIAGEDGYQAHLQAVADEAGGMKRFAAPEEVANFIVFLCSDKASYSTGSTYFVDGGWLKTV
ncbi:SDR family oxidoreductase [Devosia sp. 63-57]|uniref:SDR family NAD(P)-dependent oxidoreductase n=1 Tax=Devosia sp. 63-57 TaxID=1895751 RepID=UPI00086A309D|nr:SDR family oxidoreductase [Devosia sp. 63-57]ODT49664.1 MAG: short-chain dehydrogenase [Pelagibacterium sp. SCN 63-126]ODU87677.1 MAG: short-chain dehydrogenase [Pelagibacterium sp. SCN 63-17]OJX45678.1 MAG: short-chain dehydrogenase [Devosia sp. 63-57]